MNDEFIKIDSFPQYLESLKPKDWQPLLDLISEIEKTQVFGEEKGGVEIKPGLYTLPYWDHVPVISKFIDLAYHLRIVIDFDWPNWDKGRELASPDNTELDSIDLLTACMLFTALIRNDRFCDGALVTSFESGLILRILNRIKELALVR